MACRAAHSRSAQRVQQRYATRCEKRREQECGKESGQEKARREFSAADLSEGHAVVIIQELRTVPAHRLFCFAASRPVRAQVLRAKAARPVWPPVVLWRERCGREVAR